MNASEMPLIGALFLSIALTTNYLLSFSRMTFDRPKTLRARTPRRQLIACAISAALPLIGAMAPLSVAHWPWKTADAPLLAAGCALTGWVLSVLMDKLMSWGTPVGSQAPARPNRNP